MQKYELKDFIRGWFVGNFEPSLFKTNDVEVGIKYYKKGDYEQKHYHKIATEITAIVNGEVKMNDEIYKAGEIIVISPNNANDFYALSDTCTVVVKLPGANNDKYLGEAKC
ncbi:hypothetical protein AVBRAN12640_09545 [Campylobacter sp. RM12640]|uniref:hypothetical protein n=1 Tax=unclassified Campylobacter TaxID=2593542 RepID=UPI0030146087|nr:hypothetical protein [Campylobacter sp. RM12640]MBZ7990022.1 hypothetical protein [Campylobacter sp. RM12635]